MSRLKSLLPFFIGALPWVSGHAQETKNDSDGNDSIKTEIKTMPMRSDSVVEVKDIQAGQVSSLTDSVGFSLCDSVMAIDTICQTHPKFEAAKFDMLCLIAHWENIKAKPYRLPGENFYTYAIGNTLTETGARVKRTDVIRDVNHLKAVFYRHIDQCIWPTFSALPLDSMSSGEIAALVSLAYNCGAGHIQKMLPYIKEYVDSRDDPARHAIAEEKLKQEFLSRCKVVRIEKRNGRKVKVKKELPALKSRRLFEWEIFTGNIIMKNTLTNEPLADNEVNLYYANIGGGYSACRKSRSAEETCRIITENQYGTNIPDSLRREIPRCVR